MPDRRTTLCNRLIARTVNGLSEAFDVIAPFWQTPREVEWAKAAADGLAEREAEEEVAEPTIERFGLKLTPSSFERLGHSLDRITEAEQSAFRSGGQTYQTGPRPTLSTSHAALCACGHWLHPGNACAACGCTNVRLPKTSAPTPGAVDGPAVGSPDKPTAGVGPVGPKDRAWFDSLWPGGARGEYPPIADVPGLRWRDCAPSAEVEPPASAPSAESPAPEFDWVTTAIPVIAGVLAEHVPSRDCDGVIYCDGTDGLIHAEFADWQDWRDHISPHIAAVLQTPRTATVHHISGDRPRPLSDFKQK